VSGGTGNQAEAENASVSGGAFNLANDLYTSISGGCDNLAAATGKPLALPSGVSCDSSGAQYASISGGSAGSIRSRCSITGAASAKPNTSPPRSSAGWKKKPKRHSESRRERGGSLQRAGVAVALLLASAVIAGTSSASAAPSPHPARTRRRATRGSATPAGADAKAPGVPGAGARHRRARTAGARPFVQNDGPPNRGRRAASLRRSSRAHTNTTRRRRRWADRRARRCLRRPEHRKRPRHIQHQLRPPACTSANGCFTKVSQTGSTTSLPKADKQGWSVEITLDVESAHAVCEICKILLVEANEPSDTDLGVAVNEAVKLGATEFQLLWGQRKPAKKRPTTIPES